MPDTRDDLIAQFRELQKQASTDLERAAYWLGRLEVLTARTLGVRVDDAS